MIIAILCIFLEIYPDCFKKCLIEYIPNGRENPNLLKLFFCVEIYLYAIYVSEICLWRLRVFIYPDAQRIRYVFSWQLLTNSKLKTYEIHSNDKKALTDTLVYRQLATVILFFCFLTQDFWVMIFKKLMCIIITLF